MNDTVPREPSPSASTRRPTSHEKTSAVSTPRIPAIFPAISSRLGWRWPFGGAEHRRLDPRALLYLLPLAQLGILLWVIWTRTAAVPYWDEWETVLLVQHARQGTLTLSELWAPHATAHRIVLPRLIDLALIQLTGWNRQLEMTFDLAVGAASAWMLWSCVRRTVSARAALVLLVPVSLLLLSFSQFANWFAPFQLPFILTAFGVACCMRGLSGATPTRRGFALALAGAFIASLSSLPGVLPWVAFLPSVARAGYRKIALWLACGVVTWVAYFHNFPHAVQGMNIVSDGIYTLVYLGAAVGYPHSVVALMAGAASVGLLVCGVCVYLRMHKSVRDVHTWLSLALFVLLCSQATASGRTGVGATQAMASRYQVFTVLWWLSLAVFAALTLPALVHGMKLGRVRRSAFYVVGVNLALLLLATVGLALANGVGLVYGITWQDVQRQHEASIVWYDRAPASCLHLYYPFPAMIPARAAFLEQQRLAIFASDPRSAQGATMPAYFVTGCTKPYEQYMDDAGTRAVASRR